MMDEMASMWEGFQCNGEIIADRQRGAHVVIHVPLADCSDAFTHAYLFRNGDEFVCIADFYMGEGAEFRGTEGNWYTVDDCGVLVGEQPQ
jgi:hypothetical protein